MVSCTQLAAGRMSANSLMVAKLLTVSALGGRSDVNKLRGLDRSSCKHQFVS